MVVREAMGSVTMGRCDQRLLPALTKGAVLVPATNVRQGVMEAALAMGEDPALGR